MNETDVTPHNYYFLQATEDELRELILIIDQSEDRTYNWESLINWARGREPALPASSIISILREIAERRR